MPPSTSLAAPRAPEAWDVTRPAPVLGRSITTSEGAHAFCARGQGRDSGRGLRAQRWLGPMRTIGRA